jgi:hypothetical protein
VGESTGEGMRGGGEGLLKEVGDKQEGETGE